MRHQNKFFQKYSIQKIQTLEACSIFEKYFALDDLSYLAEKNHDEIKEYLAVFLKDGIIICKEGYYKFKHFADQISIYSEISIDKKKWLHFRIGKYLLNKKDGKLQEESILYHFDNSLELLIHEKDICRIANLYLKQSKKAKENLEFEVSHDYAQVGIWLLNESLDFINKSQENYANSWEKYPNLLSQLHLEAIESSFSNNNYEKMGEHIDELFVFSKLYLQDGQNYDASSEVA